MKCTLFGVRQQTERDAIVYRAIFCVLRHLVRAGSLLSALLILFCPAHAQTPAPGNPVLVTPPQSGQEMYIAYCASCHGRDGKGNGPVSPALRTAPPDLTQLSRKNQGKFPTARVAQIIRSGPDLPAHGSTTMPIWGQLFLAMDQHDDLVVRQRVLNLAKYIRSLQEK